MSDNESELGIPSQTVITLVAETMERLPNGKVDPSTKLMKRKVVSLKGNSTKIVLSKLDDLLNTIAQRAKELNSDS